MSDVLQLLVVIGSEVTPPAGLAQLSKLPAPVRGAAFAGRIVPAGGVPPYSYAHTAGTLPAGVSLDTGTGEVVGTPTTQDYYEFEVTVTDGNADSDAVVYSLQVGGGIVIDTAFPESVHDIPYNAILSATGGTPPYTWTLQSGSLPTGLSLVGDSISGTPVNATNGTGIWYSVLRATDANGNYAEAEAALLLWPPAWVSDMYSTVPSVGYVNGNYAGIAGGRHAWNDLPPLAGGTADGPAISYSLSNQPPGLSIDPATGKITGIPTTAGDYTMDVDIVDVLGSASTRAFGMRIYPNGQMKKFSTLVGDGLSTDLTVTHGFLSEPYSVLVYDTAAANDPFEVPWTPIDDESITLSFKDPPAIDQMLVKVLG